MEIDGNTISAALERESYRLDNKIFESPRVVNLSDIKRIITELGRIQTKPQQVTVTKVIDGGKERVLSAPTLPASKRDIILTMLAEIEKTIGDATQEAVLINGKPVKPLSFQGDARRVALDRMLARWFNAYSEGEFICWKLRDGTFKYNIKDHKLFKDTPQ
jgi:hypothetical protein